LIDGDAIPLYGNRGVRYAKLLFQIGRHGEATLLIKANENALQDYFEGYFEAPECLLILAKLLLSSGDLQAARTIFNKVYDCLLCRNTKELLCWAALIKARIELAEARNTKAKGKRQKAKGKRQKAKGKKGRAFSPGSKRSH
jgi:ATP/maltotriose-dependent transcriptional regulator MalT